MIKLPIEIDTVKGFLHPDEGEALYNICLEISSLGPALEVGSYCGKSAIYLGLACLERDNTLYTIDHHRGSEEHQPGEGYHDEELFDSELNQMDSFLRVSKKYRDGRTLGKCNSNCFKLRSGCEKLGRSSWNGFYRWGSFNGSCSKRLQSLVLSY